MRRFQIFFILCLLLSALHGLNRLWHYRHDKWPDQLYNQPVPLQGTVINLPQQTNNAESFQFKTDHGTVQLNWYIPHPELRPGQEWQLTAKIKPDLFQNNPGEFDYGAYLREQGVVASGFVMAKFPAEKIAMHPWHVPVESLRFHVYQRIIAATDHLAMQGVLIALILGDKTLLSPYQWQVFSTSGISYFMVISGLHIILFAAMGALVLRYLWSLIPLAPLKIPAQRIGLLAGLGLGLLYSLLAGFPIPTQRALWMLWLIGLARLFLIRIQPMALLFAALAIVLLYDPLSIHSVAFWLSFLAVFFLIYTLSMRYRKPSKLEDWLYLQWVMYFALMPVLIDVFHQFSAISFITNFIAVPFMMLAVIPLALLGGISVFISPTIGHLLFTASNWIMAKLWLILVFAVDIPHTFFVFPAPHLSSVILSIGGCLILFAPKGFPLRLSGAILLLPLLFPKPALQEREINITTLRLQEGTATVFETAHEVILQQNINHLRQAKAALHDVIEPYLISRGQTEVNVWVVNGVKNNHALQSLKNAWKSIGVNSIILPHPLKIYDSSVSNCVLPQVFKSGYFTFSLSLADGACQVSVHS